MNMTSGSSIYRNSQEEFWAGENGNSYIERNSDSKHIPENLFFFSKVLQKTNRIDSVLELGANIGLNLKSLQLLFPDISLNAIEINPQACEILREFLPIENVFEQSIMSFRSPKKFELVFTKGVLIHNDPADLPDIYDLFANLTNRYILISEYFNPVPVSVRYFGSEDLLFKRDFAGEFLDRHKNFELIDYGFFYRRDPHSPQDDETWFLIERRI